MVLLRNKTRTVLLFGDVNPPPLPSVEELSLSCSREACYHKSRVYPGLGLLERKAWKICKAHLSFFPTNFLTEAIEKQAHYLLEFGETVQGNKERQ